MNDVPNETQENQPRIGFVKMNRTPDIVELIEAAPLAFTLAAVIALRARFQSGVSLKGLRPGEAFLGDHDRYGMTMQQYRTAKAQLARWGFASFKTTSRGTTATLINTRLFDVLNAGANKLPTGCPQETKPEKNGKKWKGEGARKAPHALSSEKVFERPSEEAVSNYAVEHDLDLNFATEFFCQHQSKGWLIPNRITRKLEPVRDWRKALEAFCEKLEADRVEF